MAVLLVYSLVQVLQICTILESHIDLSWIPFLYSHHMYSVQWTSNTISALKLLAQKRSICLQMLEKRSSLTDFIRTICTNTKKNLSPSPFYRILGNFPWDNVYKYPYNGNEFTKRWKKSFWLKLSQIQSVLGSIGTITFCVKKTFCYGST